jgi:hypothetical protein
MSINDAIRNSKAAVLQREAKAAKEAEKPADYDPPPNSVPEHTWIDIEYTARNGARYRAHVLYTVPTIEQVIRVGQVKTAIVGTSVRADLTADQISYQIAYMAVAFDEKTLPTWWNPNDARDFGPYSLLYGKAVAYEEEYFRGGQVSRVLSPRADNEASDDGGASTPDPDAVGGEVQPAAKRSEILVG